MVRRNRTELQKELLEIAPKAWYQRPPDNKMTYPCFVYKSLTPEALYADNRVYTIIPCYEILYVCQNESDWIWEKMTEKFGAVAFGPKYVSDNLYYYTFTLYY